MIHYDYGNSTISRQFSVCELRLKMLDVTLFIPYQEEAVAQLGSGGHGLQIFEGRTPSNRNCTIEGNCMFFD